MPDFSTHSNLPVQFYLAAGLACARRIFQRLDVHWDGPELGMNRLTMTDRETEGLNILTSEAQAMGMEAFELLSGSRMFIYQGEDASLAPDIVGSHIDSVRKGGRYDGPAGIVAGMAAVATVHDRFLKTGVRPKRTIIVLADRGEESVEYNQFGIASGMNAAKFGPEILNAVSTTNGKTWEENARKQGLDVDALREKITAREALIPFDCVARQWELHIEQGSKLANAGVSIGVVDDFRGNVRYAGRVHFKGRADHTGATEMPDRLDAGDALIGFHAHVKHEANVLLRAGHDLVYTFHFQTDDDRTSISENAYCAVEARSKSPETLKLFEAIVDAAIQKQQEAGYGVNPNYDKMKRTAPISLDTQCQQMIRDTANELGISSMNMTSGAGHDLMNYAPKVRAGFISFAHGNGGLSHGPGEIAGMTPEQDPYREGCYPLAISVVTNLVTRDERQMTGKPQDVSRGDFRAELIKRGAKPLTLAA